MPQSLHEKLDILSEAAKYDAVCGSARERSTRPMNTPRGVFQVTTPTKCMNMLKLLQSNECIYDCAYCANRRSADVPRATFEPQELVDLVMEFNRKGYIDSLFLSSGIRKNPDYTMELMIKTLEILRPIWRGYIHVKIIPGASQENIARIGYLCNRVSCNIEMPSAQSLELLAPQKKPKIVVQSLQTTQQTIIQADEEIRKYRYATRFAPSGQSTQMVIGATPDTDFTIMNLAENMYSKLDMKRTYYSAYAPVGQHEVLPGESVPQPFLRQHRLYQSDWLLRFYQFQVNELLSENNPNLDLAVDPKTNWALNNLHIFPIEVNRADREMLLRIPGLGPTSVDRIVHARRMGRVNWDDLRKMGAVLKRAQYFLTANGKFHGRLQPDSQFLHGALVQEPTQEQLSMFAPA